MQVQLIKEPFEYIQIDDTYTNEELRLIFLELDFLCLSKNLEPPEKTNSAFDKLTGRIIKQNHGLFLDGLYSDRKFSNILKSNRKIFGISVDGPSVILNYLRESNYDSTLISYYENSDHYESHKDDSFLTTLTYLYKQPKIFSGGELIATEYNLTFEPVFNRTYIIPSVVEHEVKAVVMSDRDAHKGFGRYCISNFVYKNPRE